jgi:SAM-dependent methyltransferase
MGSASASITEIGLEDHLERLRRDHAHIYNCLDVERARAWFTEFSATTVADDFGTELAGGRGEQYLNAQLINFTARATGIGQILDIMREDPEPARRTIVDVLGGDGLVERVAAALGVSDVDFLTCDLSPYMVNAAWALGHPALLQRADRLLQKDSSVDGVLVAYGSHHIELDDRADVAREAYRVLKPGGVFVLHDFLDGSAMDEWFSEVVDRHSVTGHDYPHFTRPEMQGYLAKAGFESYEVVEMPDPYVATAPTAEEAELALGRYLRDMYGLVRIGQTWGDGADRWVIDRAKDVFTEDGGFSLVHDDEAGLWRCTVSRTAVVGIGRKIR